MEKKGIYGNMLFSHDMTLEKHNLVSFTATNVGEVPVNVLQRTLTPGAKIVIDAPIVFSLEMNVAFCTQTQGKKALLIDMVSVEQCP